MALLDRTTESLPGTWYHDPAQYAHQAVLVVGGGDSAVEAAIAISQQPGTDVTLSYRGATLRRALRPR